MIHDPLTKREGLVRWAGRVHAELVTDPRIAAAVLNLPTEHRTYRLSPYSTITTQLHRNSRGEEVPFAQP